MTGLPDSYFERMYAADPDPWGFESRWYERRKYALTMAMLPEPHYGSAFEPGCSVGVLTEHIARRCDSVLSTDIADAALDRARRREIPNATFAKASLRDGWPEGPFDLVMLSEMCYYFEPFELESIAASAVSVTAPNGIVCAVHWRHVVAEYPSTADQVHAALRSAEGMALTAQYQDDDVMIDVFRVRAASTSRNEANPPRARESDLDDVVTHGAPSDDTR